MKNNYLFWINVFIFIFSMFFLFYKLAFADFSYTRTPSDFEIKNPVQFDIVLDNDFKNDCISVGANNWFFYISSFPDWNDFFISPFIDINDNEEIFNLILPSQQVSEITLLCSNATVCKHLSGGLTCNGNVGFSYQLDYGEPSFIIKSSFFTNPINIGSTTEIFASIGTLVTDLWVLIAVAIGVPLAFYVIPKVIALF